MSTDEQQVLNGEAHGQVLMAICNEMVGLYKVRLGRGPTASRAVWATENVVTVFLEDTLAPMERQLASRGDHGRLREMRTHFQYASLREFCEPVERITGRKVRAFLSATDIEVDGLSMETFVLHPVGFDGPSRTEIGT